MAAANKRVLPTLEEEIMANRRLRDELLRSAARLKAARLAIQQTREYWDEERRRLDWTGGFGRAAPGPTEDEAG